MNTRVQKFQQAAESYFSGSAPGGAVLVGKGKEVIWGQGFGVADAAAGIPVKPDTRFLIGSVSKQFTAMAVLALVEKGKLGLADPITRFFPSFPAYGQAITLHHLLTHTSGIREYLGDEFWNDPRHAEQDISQKEVIALIESYPTADFWPGTRFSYCNSGYVMLGEIIEETAECSFREFIEETLLKPAGMAETVVGTDPDIPVKNLARGYRALPNGEMETAPYTMATIGWADGNLASTVGDLFRWHRFLQERPPVGPDLLKAAYTPYRTLDNTSTGYGYGWFIHCRRGIQEYWHSGGTQGFTCRFSRFPQEDAVVAVLTNYETSPRDALVGEMSQILLGESMTAWVGTDLEPLDSQELAGVYNHPERELPITVMVNADGTTASSPMWVESGSVRILQLEPGCYRLDSPHDYYLFWEQEEGKKKRLILDANGRRICLAKENEPV